MGQVSGAVSLDMTNIQRQIEEAVKTEVSHEINRQLVPRLDRLSAQVSELSAWPLEGEDLIGALAGNLPVIEGFKPLVIRGVAEFLAARLTEQGYALVPVSGAPLEAARLRQKASDPTAAAIARADARLAQARINGADDSWFERDED